MQHINSKLFLKKLQKVALRLLEPAGIRLTQSCRAARNLASSSPRSGSLPWKGSLTAVLQSDGDKEVRRGWAQ